MKICKVGLIGIGGFGGVHAQNIIQLSEDKLLQCIAFADPGVENNKGTYEQLKRIGAKHYSDYKDMLTHHPEIDFVVIATPIPLHKEMSIEAMERGFHVMLEKPPAVTIQDIDDIIAAQRRTERKCCVNFQNTSGAAFRLLLKNINESKLGEIQSVTGVGMWKRTDQYYERAAWAGKLTLNGSYVLDGTINNPLAHLVHNCLIIAGEGKPAAPHSVQAELYKGHDIESEDTTCLRIQTHSKARIQLYMTLCHERQEFPYILVKGTHGEAYWDYTNQLRIQNKDEELREYQLPEENLVRNMYLNFMEVLSKENTEPFCSIEACRSFVLTSNGAFESSQQTYKIPSEYLDIRKEGDTIATSLIDSKQLFEEAVQHEKLFSELSVDWAVQTHAFSLEGYKDFQLFRDRLSI